MHTVAAFTLQVQCSWAGHCPLVGYKLIGGPQPYVDSVAMHIVGTYNITTFTLYI